jgi:hypothetical protein
MEFPTLVYRKHANGMMTLPGIGTVRYAGVADAVELAAHVEAGWFVWPLNDDAPPTRAELVQKAKELGLEFHHKTGDAKLAAMIAEALG